MRTELQLQGLEGVLHVLRQLPPEVASRRGGPVRAALRKGAKVIHAQALANLQSTLDAATDEGERQSTGLLLQNLVVTRGKEPTGTKGERYLVRVRRKSYQRNGQPVTTLKTAQIKEYGSVKQQPEPWLVPAFKARAREAVLVIERETMVAVQRAVKKLARLRASAPRTGGR